MNNVKTFKNKLVLSTAIAGITLLGYGRRSYAACSVTVSPNFECSGANAVTQTVNTANANITTVPGFSINAAAGNALTSTALGALSFTDTNASTISTTAATGIGLSIVSTGASGGTDGSVIINTNSNITGGIANNNASRGIFASNAGLGITSVTVNGDVTSLSTSAGNAAVWVQQTAAANTNTVTVTTGIDSDLTGGRNGIRIANASQGATLLTVDGNVSASGSSGIGISVDHTNAASTASLTIITGIDSSITSLGNNGNYAGIQAKNSGLGATDITVNGNITATAGARGVDSRSSNGSSASTNTITTSVNSNIIASTDSVYVSSTGSATTVVNVNGDITSYSNSGINVSKFAAGYTGDIIISTGIDSTINSLGSFGTGISVLNDSLADLIDITVDGDINSFFQGVYVTMFAAANADINIATGADSVITSGYDGILVKGQDTTGAVNINVYGSLSSSAKNGINIYKYGGATTGNITITTGSDSSVTGANNGINIYHQGSDAVSITVNGDVTGTTGAGIFIDSVNALADITLNSGASVSGDKGFAATAATQSSLSIDGTTDDVTITGTGGTAIEFGGLADTLSLVGDVNINGDILGGGGTDIINFDNVTLTLGAGDVISGFETFNLTGTNRINGDLDATGVNLVQSAGSNLHVNGAFTADSFTVSNGSEFGGNNTFTGDLIIDNGGTLAPGNSIGTINVVGDVTFLTGSNFEVEVSGNTSDKVTATGNIVIQNGVTLDVVPLGTFSGGVVTFLTGATLTGTFDPVNMNGVAASIVYTATSASLFGANYSSLNAQASTIGQGSMLFGNTVEDELANNMFKNGDHYWVKTLYSNNNRQTDATFAGYSSHIYGAAFGAQYDVSDNWNVGYAVGDLFNNTNVKLAADDTKSNSILSSVYGTYTLPFDEMDMFTSVGLVGGYTSADNKRAVNDNGTPLMAKSDNTALQSGAFWQVGARNAISTDWNIMPKLGVAYYRTDVDGYTEESGGAAAVSIDDYTFSRLKTSQSVSLYNNKEINFDEVKIVPKFNLGFTQEHVMDGGSVTGAFSTGTATNFQLDESDRNFFNTGLSADISFSDTLTGQFSYNHAFSDTEARNEIRVDITKRF